MAPSSLGSTANKTTVGIADLKVMRCAEGILVTHALGSCIGVTVFDPEAGVLGMLHFMLPELPANKSPNSQPPAMCATTGVPLLFRKALDMGASKSKMIICLAGGSSLMGDQDRFQIGKRNRLILRKMFWKNGVRVSGDDSGGNAARTMTMDMTSGRVNILSRGKEKTLWKA